MKPTGTDAAPPPDAKVQAEFDALFDRTALRMERVVALVVMFTATMALGLGLAARAAGTPLGVIALWSAAVFIAFYAADFALLRAGMWRPWMRYVASLVDVTLATLVYVSDYFEKGWLFSLTAVGPVLYALAVSAAALRLDPRLSIYAGVVAATQFTMTTYLVILPNAPPEYAVLGDEQGFVALIKALFILAVGVFGAVATRTMRRLLFRLTWSAVERERVRGLFGMYVSEEIVDTILSGSLREGGERRSCTVLFSDIRDFTRLAETRPPEEVVRLLNLYFERMCRVVAKHGGVVNKFLGDGMLVVFGAPAAVADDARRALRCAQEMAREAQRMNAEEAFPRLKIGVGIHRGETVMGSVGGSQRQEYTVIGDTVNTAARVQDLTKVVGRSILITSAVRDGLLTESVDALGWHAVKGREALLELYAPPEEQPSEAPVPEAMPLKLETA